MRLNEVQTEINFIKLEVIYLIGQLSKQHDGEYSNLMQANHFC